MKRADEMRAAFGRFEGSGLTLKAFGEKEGIPYTTLQYWRRRFREGAGKLNGAAKLRAGSLAPVRVVSEVVQAAPRDGRFEVWLANGVSFEVPAGFDANDLDRLVRVLSGC